MLLSSSWQERQTAALNFECRVLRRQKSHYDIHFLAFSLYLQVDDSICANALHGVEFQIPLEVSGIESGNGQTIAKTSLHVRR